ncbi:MAG TPA: hypothetical protein VFW21_11685 [Mycobacterium sp.]|nr:hypothetical protein [Mycobacterium sp.]
MAEFVLTYRMPEGYQMGNTEMTAAWQAWFAGIGDNLVELGKPASCAQVVGRSGEGTWLGGFSVIRADSAEQALDVARGCPGIAAGGGVEVGALIDLPCANRDLSHAGELSYADGGVK